MCLLVMYWNVFIGDELSGMCWNVNISDVSFVLFSIKQDVFSLISVSLLLFHFIVTQYVDAL